MKTWYANRKTQAEKAALPAGHRWSPGERASIWKGYAGAFDRLSMHQRLAVAAEFKVATATVASPHAAPAAEQEDIDMRATHPRTFCGAGTPDLFDA